MFKFVLFFLAALAAMVSGQSTCTPVTVTETYISTVTVPAHPSTATIPVSSTVPYPTAPAPIYPTGTAPSASWYPTATATGYGTAPPPFTGGASIMNGNVLIAAFAAVGAAAALL